MHLGRAQFLLVNFGEAIDESHSRVVLIAITRALNESDGAGPEVFDELGNDVGSVV